MSGDRDNRVQELWQVPLQGTPRKLDIDGNKWELGARISPDGRYIAFHSGKRSVEIRAIENLQPR